MHTNNNTSFRGITPYSVTSGLDTNVFLNKALFDVTGSDAPWVIMANNKEERRERINRATVSFGLIFLSPLMALPLINRLAMKKLTPKVFSKEWQAIKLSNSYLGNAEDTKNGLNQLSKDLKIDFKPIIDKVGGDYEKLRKKIVVAKNIVLASDFALVTGSFGHIGFYNNRQTEKKTGSSGYSAEISMADKDTVNKRAENYKKTSKTKYKIFLTTLGALVLGVPLAIAHGLNTKKINKFSNFVKKHASKFDYNDAIFMDRLPLALGLGVAHLGINLASRNKTETKDNAIRSSIPFAIFFGGDLLMARILSNISDRLLGTKLTKPAKKPNFLTKILPPVKKLKDLKNINHPLTKTMGVGIFWFNFVTLAATMGILTPYLINKIIKKDIEKDSHPNKIASLNKKTFSSTFKKLQLSNRNN